MQKIKFLFIIILCLLSINVISANEIESDDTNSIELNEIDYNNNPQQENNDALNKENCLDECKYTDLQKSDNNLKTKEYNKANTSVDSFSNTENNLTKTTSKIFIKSNRIKSRDTITLYLKDSNNIPLKNKKIKINLNSKTYSILTDSKGTANLKLTLVPKKYPINIEFEGDEDFNSTSKRTEIYVSKLSTKIRFYSNFVVKKGHLYIYLLGKDGEGVSDKLKITIRKKTFIKNTNKNGRIGIKINLKPGTYPIIVKYKGNTYFNPSSKKLKFHVTKSLKFYLANNKLIKNGYLRIYLKNGERSAISKKKFLIKIGKQKYYKKTNGEGIIVLKVDVPANTYNVMVKYGKYSLTKKINCIEDDIKDPFQNKIHLINGIPDIDYMPGNYVMGDDSATYTLKRSQYLEVIKRDSYCLFLNNKLSKYVIFRTTKSPNTYHILKRGKWNVIEKEINKRIVAKNKYNYWPGKIKVSLKGKYYSHSEVRDVQNTGYTCGPTSASVCTQVLRNYLPEGYLAKISGTNKSGTKIQKLEAALNKHNFICTHFYRNSFNYAIGELKKGGCALVFHSQHHYVSILDISGDGKKVLVSNSYGTYNNIPSKWLSVSYMNTKFGFWDDSLVVRLNYNLTDSIKNSINCFYNSMGINW